MNLKVKKYLFDIQTAVSAILDEYLKDAENHLVLEESSMLRSAIERQIITIGEAIYRLRQMGIMLTDTDKIINRRNTLVHQYDAIKPQTLWTFCKFDLPRLKEEVDSLLDEK